MRPKKKISQNDIAKALGISNVSVSNALAGKKGVSGDLTAKVRRMADRMGYRAQEDVGCGQAMVVLAVSDRRAAAEADCFGEILRELRFQVRYFPADETADGEYARVCGQENCLGVLVPEPLASDQLLALREISKKPVVGIGFFDSRVPIDYVMDDGFHGAQAVVQHLRGKGYARILYVKPKRNGPASEAGAVMQNDRLLGYRSELYLETMNRGRTIGQAQPFDEMEEERGILTLQDAQTYLKRRRAVLSGQKEAVRTALFCGDMETARILADDFAKGLFGEQGDVAIAGYAVSEPCLVCGERITVYENSGRRLLEQCIAVLQDRSCGGDKSAEVHLVSGEIMESGAVWPQKGRQSGESAEE